MKDTMVSLSSLVNVSGGANLTDFGRQPIARKRRSPASPDNEFQILGNVLDQVFGEHPELQRGFLRQRQPETEYQLG